MLVRDKIRNLLENFLLERGADPTDLKFLKELPLEVILTRNI